MKFIPVLLLPPIVFWLYVRAEPRYYSDSGVLGVLSLAFLASLVIATVVTIRFVRRTNQPWKWIVFGVVAATGPLVDPLLDFVPNVHGEGMLLLLVYLLAAWPLAAYLIVVGTWRLIASSRH